LLKFGWFSTGRDEAARQLLQAAQSEIHSGEINGKIGFVFSNREPGESKESDLFFELVKSYGIPLVCFSHREFRSRLLPPRGVYPERDSSVASLPQNDGGRKARDDRKRRARGRNDIALMEEWRLRYDREVDKRVAKFAPDLCVLAGYMLIVGQELCQKYSMINLHPAPPGGPRGSWQEVIWTLIQGKAQEAGAMMHLVTPELDRGPVVGYCIFPIRGKPFDPYWQKGDKDMLFQLIRQHELAREFPLIISTLKALSQGEIRIRDGKVMDAQGRSIEGYDLSAKIDKAVESKIASLRSQ
jgi:folate-dependent phosphoribosylglycinamide formyltransferase PurN